MLWCTVKSRAIEDWFTRVARPGPWWRAVRVSVRDGDSNAR
jgi:hypothetical protein